MSFLHESEQAWLSVQVQAQGTDYSRLQPHGLSIESKEGQTVEAKSVANKHVKGLEKGEPRSEQRLLTDDQRTQETKKDLRYESGHQKTVP